jgi:hypothetical protein
MTGRLRPGEINLPDPPNRYARPGVLTWILPDKKLISYQLKTCGLVCCLVNWFLRALSSSGTWIAMTLGRNTVFKKLSIDHIKQERLSRLEVLAASRRVNDFKLESRRTAESR